MRIIFTPPLPSRLLTVGRIVVPLARSTRSHCFIIVRIVGACHRIGRGGGRCGRAASGFWILSLWDVFAIAAVVVATSRFLGQHGFRNNAGSAVIFCRILKVVR
jgi:hypothetical protein